MPVKMFKDRFCEIQKVKLCLTTEELDFNAYTEPGTYEIYEDMGEGRSRIYFLTVDKSASGACVKQTRIYCGAVETRQTNTSGEWKEWEAVTGGMADLSDYVKKTDYGTEEVPGVFRKATLAEVAEGRTPFSVLTPYIISALFDMNLPTYTNKEISDELNEKQLDFPPSTNYLRHYVAREIEAAVTAGVDLSEYVKNTDFASSAKHGIIKLAEISEVLAGANDDTTAMTPYLTKVYVNEVVGDISAALDELHTYATSLTGGAE